MNIKIPHNCISYILYQRTAYIKGLSMDRLAKKSIEKSGLVKTGTTFNRLVNLNARLNRQNIKARYLNDIDRDFNSIKPFLPKNPKNILDIGCGIAGIDLFLSSNYNNEPNLYLIDKTAKEDNVYYGFESKGSFYNSLENSVEFLKINGVPDQHIFTQEATIDNSINFNVQFDLIVSLISWGYHYPVSTYLNDAYDKLNENGKLIIDVRKDSGGEEEIRSKFGNAEIIYAEGQCTRIMAIR